MERLYPERMTMAPEEIYQDLSFPVMPWARPYLALNMVSSVDGKATLLEKAFPLGSKIDHMVMRRIRAAADAVMNGSQTLRKEKVNPRVPEEVEARRVAQGMTPQPAAVVVTISADLPLDNPFFRGDRASRIVVTTQRAPIDRVAAIERHAKVIRVGEETVDLEAMMEELVTQFGIRRLVCEGGPTLNSHLIAAGLVDELFWTVSPKIVAGPATRTLVEGPPLPVDSLPRLQLVNLHEHESELYLRYRFPERAGPFR